MMRLVRFFFQLKWQYFLLHPSSFYENKNWPSLFKIGVLFYNAIYIYTHVHMHAYVQINVHIHIYTYNIYMHACINNFVLYDINFKYN